jgi:hypothetical protein
MSTRKNVVFHGVLSLKALSEKQKKQGEAQALPPVFFMLELADY